MQSIKLCSSDERATGADPPVVAGPTARLHAAPSAPSLLFVHPTASRAGTHHTYSTNSCGPVALQMEMEMDQLSRAFGMPGPSFFSPSASLFDLPAADLPAAMPTMAKSLVS